MIVPLSRAITIAMFAVLCFALIVPMALRRGNTAIAIGISVAFLAYAIVNIVLWQRTNTRR